MQIKISGQHFDVGDSLKDHVQAKLTTVSEKYFENPIESNVVFTKEAGYLVRADVTMHVGRNIIVQAHGEEEDPYQSFDSLLSKLEKQLRRYKDRLRDHHKRMAEAERQTAQQYVLASSAEEGPAPEPDLESAPTVVAEMSLDIDTLTVGEAVMRLDLSNEPVVIFHNSAHGGLNLVFRRKDGNISWVDPQNLEKSSAAE